MEYREFDECLAELKSFYGDNAYMPKMASLIWQIVQPLTKGECLEVIERIVQKHAKTPMPAFIKQEALPFLQRAWERERQLRIAELAKGEPCSYCGHSGVIFALKRSDVTLEYSFGCPFCPAYRARRLRHPKLWDESLKADFIPVSLRPESFVAASELRSKAMAAKAPPKADGPVIVDPSEWAALAAKWIKPEAPRGEP